MSSPQQPPTSAADLAERALIGALLRDSQRVREVRGWLRAGDLTHSKARSIYATLAGLHREGRSVPLTELPEVIAAGTYHDSPLSAVTAEDLNTYVRSTPATPAASEYFPAELVASNHVVYARRVLEAAARHAVAVTGSRIQEAVEYSREHPDLGAPALAAALAATQQRLADLGERLRYSQGHPGSLITAALGGLRHEALAPEPVGVRPAVEAPPLSVRAVIEAEREVLAACLTDPTLRAELLGWLVPEDFSRPEHAATWACFTSLAQAGTPIDYVTLAWECERYHPDCDSRGLPADQLVTMARHPTGLPGEAVRIIAHASLLRHTETAQQQVQAITEDRSATALTVVSTAEQAYQQVVDHARRLTGAPTPVSRASAALQAPAPASATSPHSPTPPPTRPPDEPPQRDHRLGR